MPRTLEELRAMHKAKVDAGLFVRKPKAQRLREAARAAIRESDWKQIIRGAVREAAGGCRDARKFLLDVMKDPAEVDSWLDMNEQLRKKLAEVQARNAELETELDQLRKRSAEINNAVAAEHFAKLEAGQQ